jgi:cell division protein DivIC
MKIASSFSIAQLMQTLTKLLFNKYCLAGFIFVVWVCFFDKNSLITQYKLTRTLNELREQRTFLINEIEVTKSLKADLDKNVEKYAREKYYMKKPGERVFIIE